MSLQKWFRHGVMNTLEHALTRFADAGITILLLSLFSPEAFSKIALSQALIAPILFFFLSPENTIYRDFGHWKSQGSKFLFLRISSIRYFGYFKAFLALVFSFLLGGIHGGDTFYTLLWAFVLTVGPQIVGIDREFLRMNLQIGVLTGIGIVQKSILFIGTIWVGHYYSGRLDYLAFCAVSSFLISGILYKYFVDLELNDGRKGSEILNLQFLKDAISNYAFWTHCQGIILNWMLTVDLFFIGFWMHFGMMNGATDRLTGLYSTVIKISNLSFAIPTALANLFSVWLGQRGQNDSSLNEKAHLKRFSLYLILANTVQAIIIILCSEWGFRLLSRGRWTDSEQNMMQDWLKISLLSTLLMSSMMVLGAWLTVRTPIRKLFFRVYFVWGLVGCAAEFVTVYQFGYLGAVWMKSGVSLVYIVLVILFLMIHSKTKSVS